MEEVVRAPSFLIDDSLWVKFNAELRAACHWCTHHHTTTPAEAAKQLERGEGWPRDWISRKVKNSTRQFGGLFICPAPDCPGHANTKGERRRRWFCRFCINRHLGVDLKSFFQLDEGQGKWVQVPSLICWHCQAKLGSAVCINCPQKHTKRAKRLRDGQGLILERALLTGHHPQVGGSSGMSVGLLGAAAGDVSYDGASSEAREHMVDGQSMDESNFGAGEGQGRLSLLHGAHGAELRFISGPGPGPDPDPGPGPGPGPSPSPGPGPGPSQQQRAFFAKKGVLCRDSQASVVPFFIDYLNASCTPFHATAEARRHLLEAGFEQLGECDEWELQPGGRYFFTRNMSSIFAFAIGRKYKPGGGFNVVAAHTDSPCPKIKPVSAAVTGGFLRVRVHAYGMGLWQTWFDRDLSIAGRVLRRKKNGDLAHELVRVRRPVLRIPTSDFHLDRSGSSELLKQDMESQLAPVLATQIEAELTMSAESDSSMPVGNDSGVFYASHDVHHPVLLQVGSDAGQNVGPQTMYQAMTRIARWLARDSKSEGVVERSIRRSFIVSADMAYALHPNHADSQMHSHQPRLQDGIVIKHHPLQSNSTDTVSAFLFREVAKRNCIPTQSFAVMSDMGCCSTVNPLIAAGYGFRIVDCGLPQLSMHSVREMCGTEDIDSAFRHFKAFFQDIVSLDEQLRVDS
ncbi:hypothetical protein O6H91_07G001900 [Diphasiastrum complanatum]|uniref:Uncharacterized protein n=1 Tax=Diphasiastrum complanatum TaxID=34168 RepID=A0ACC2D1S1_DIPCM|nr:hypothetical protein O6H91_07G001900 [Diphasiastrum complanatum]